MLYMQTSLNSNNIFRENMRPYQSYFLVLYSWNIRHTLKGFASNTFLHIQFVYLHFMYIKCAHDKIYATLIISILCIIAQSAVKEEYISNTNKL